MSSSLLRGVGVGLRRPLYDAILATGDLSDDTVALLQKAIDAFKTQFQTSSGQPLVNEAPVPPMDRGDVGQEKITRHRRTPEQVEKAAGPMGRGSSVQAPG